MAGLVPAIFVLGEQQSIFLFRHPGESRDPASPAAIAELQFGMEKHPAIYIMASRYRGTLYVGVTSNLYSRVCDHKNGTTPGFTSDYKVHTLVWYEHHRMMDSAILREKRIKDWKRRWKIELIEKRNPHWRDLHDDIDVLATLIEE